jgi:predicted ATP-grasp superfamily ATP-dependent carboligase
VYEHITGGGCAGTELPQELVPQARLMLNALLDDLNRIRGVRAFALCDARLAGSLGNWEQRVVFDRDGWGRSFDRALAQSDAVWPIAPETEGALERLSARVLAEQRTLLGSRPHAVRIAASKLATANALREAGVPCVPTFGLDTFGLAGLCVAKPDDGCGCEATRRFDDFDAARAWIDAQAQPGRFVMQPFIAGEPISLSVLACDSGARLLAVNRQHVVMHGDEFAFAGCQVNALEDSDGMLAGIARRVVEAIPGLWGYVGIDALLTPSGPLVLEVNPRLTTSYAGLRTALATNVARLVLEMSASDGLPEVPAPPARTVTLRTREA